MSQRCKEPAGWTGTKPQKKSSQWPSWPCTVFAPYATPSERLPCHIAMTLRALNLTLFPGTLQCYPIILPIPSLSYPHGGSPLQAPPDCNTLPQNLAAFGSERQVSPHKRMQFVPLFRLCPLPCVAIERCARCIGVGRFGNPFLLEILVSYRT